jgi:transcriptional/translational regulatory protein YebC/TACO1
MVIDCQTDNKARTLQDLRIVIKDHGCTATPTSYMFSRRGRVVFERREHLGINEVFDDAVEAGAEDIDVDKSGNIIVKRFRDQKKA